MRTDIPVYIKIISGSLADSKFEITETPITIGRATKNSICIDDNDASRHHAHIVLKNNSVWVEDLDSTNGTYINNSKISSRNINVGDHLVIGSTEFEIIQNETNKDETFSDVRSLANRILAEGKDAHKTIIMTSVLDSAGRIKAKDKKDDINFLKRAVEHAQVLHELNALLAMKIDFDELAHAILDKIVNVMSANRAAIFGVDESGKDFYPLAYWGEDKDSSKAPISRSILHQVMKKRQAVVLSDIPTIPDTSESIIIQGMRSAICVPMINSDRIFGAIHVDSTTRSNAFGEEDLRLLVSIAQQASMWLAHAELLKEREHELLLRSKLSRFLSKELIDEIVSGRLDVGQGGQTSEITVLFSDLRGFTQLSSKMKPEAVIALMNKYFEHMVQVIFEHGGTLDKFIGDAIMVFWGAPRPNKNHAIEACRCALAMQEQLDKLNDSFAQENQHSLSMGIGIHSGKAVVGNIGSSHRLEYTALGDTVNVASRIEGLTQGGDVFISAATAKACKRQIDIHALGAQTVKGKEEAVEVYQLVSMR